MNQYFAYVRVSTARQGEGVSLQQQREAIERYAQRNQIQISRWFEEQETAAKQGRPVFGEMIKLLRRHAAVGVVIHKIDRSARNLRDWADLGELLDRGVEMHFANEALDLSSRGGRLSADIQAVVAADYIRNLREEAKKGFYGRLKQGYFPMPAPLGYIDNGAAKPKAPDPSTAPLIRQAFELYATGRYNLDSLGCELFRLGLRRSNGSALRRNRLSKLLNNSFYFGLIHIKTTGQSFAGVHEPLISKRVFDQVQSVLKGKINTRSRKHDFLYRRRLSCKNCEHSLVGETHKGFTYYRCQTIGCAGTCVREEIVEAAVLAQFFRLRLSTLEREFLCQTLEQRRSDTAGQQQEAVAGVKLLLSQTEDRLDRLTDTYIDRLIDRDAFETRKKTLLAERQDLKNQLAEWQSGKRDATTELARILERADMAYLAYKSGSLEEKRDLLVSLTSNRLIDRKTPVITLSLPFQVIADRPELQDGGARRDMPRTWTRLLTKLTQLIHNRQDDLQPATNSPSAA